VNTVHEIIGRDRRRMIGRNSLILGKSHERVKLLETGACGKLIEKLYIERNKIKIVRVNLLYSD
jgi:hypothetical protein